MGTGDDGGGDGGGRGGGGGGGGGDGDGVGVGGGGGGAYGPPSASLACVNRAALCLFHLDLVAVSVLWPCILQLLLSDSHRVDVALLALAQGGGCAMGRAPLVQAEVSRRRCA
jgi:hypothetical protein